MISCEEPPLTGGRTDPAGLIMGKLVVLWAWAFIEAMKYTRLKGEEEVCSTAKERWGLHL